MDEGYFSHLPVLAAVVVMTNGPILELGAGLGSTLMLHGLCAGQERELFTIESDKIWLEKFVNLHRDWHKFVLVDTFVNLPSYRHSWGLCFVDHGIMEQRGISVESLKDTAEVIVCHDTCHPQLYGYEPILSTFNYRWDYKLYGLKPSSPMTSVVSNTINVNKLFSETRI